MNDEAIWNKHREELIRYATLLVGPDEAEDVLSTVVLRVLQRKSLTDLDDPRPYLFRGVLNEARSVGRRRLRRPVDVASVELPRDLDPSVLEAVRALPERQRAAVYLTYWRDLPVTETASLMGCRSGTVKRYLYLARSRLKEVFNEE
ncbi:MAG: sigma-70 family RNA polymerase sigma factor [bacterium]|nr:sigma-70 family RNA polymerase sigma factor [bacterium]